MVGISPTEVPAPASRGLRYGLFTAAAGPIALPPRARDGGITYRPTSCGRARRYPIECEGDPPARVFDPPAGFITAEPFLVYGTAGPAPLVGLSQDALTELAMQNLANGEQTAVEEEMADLLAAGAVPVGVPDMESLAAVVGHLETWLYKTRLYGNVGMLHAPIWVEPYAARTGLLVKVQNEWRTHLGTVWSFGAGYADDSNLYITGAAAVWRTEEVEKYDGSAFFDRAANQAQAIVQREYAVAVDCHIGRAAFHPELAAS